MKYFFRKKGHQFGGCDEAVRGKGKFLWEEITVGVRGVGNVIKLGEQGWQSWDN